MVPLGSLQISLSSLIYETNRISQYIDDNFVMLVFYPSMFDTDIDVATYCKQLQAIKGYADKATDTNLPSDLLNKLCSLDAITENEFRYYNKKIPVLAYYVALPLGIIYWLQHLTRLKELNNILKGLERKLNTSHFMLKAVLNSQ